MPEKSPDEIAFLEQLGVRVRRARARAGLTRRRLAERSGVSERYLAQLESGDGNGSILLIRRVAAAMGTDLFELIGQLLDLGRAGRIALVGVRGAGKSTLGSRLAARLALPFVELTAEIERELGEPVSTSLAGDGQQAYRDCERRVLARVIDANARCVIAAGGSVVLEPQTWQLLRSRALTVWLKATPEDLIARVTAQNDLRPLQGREHPLAELRALLAQRERLYALADLTVDTSAEDEDRCLERLLEAAGHSGVAGPANGAASADVASP
jgi:XRE family aerobic/anaerobic benzoate catabolism transcriptional regulator